MAKRTNTEVLEALEKEVHKLQGEIKKLDSLDKDVKRIERTVEKISEKIDELKDELRAEVKDEYINNDKFEPVKLIVYGLVGLILVTVVSALLSLVVPNITQEKLNPIVSEIVETVAE